MRKILVPIAYFESCQAALALGARLARGLGAGLTVLHVAPSHSHEGLASGLASGKLAEWGIELPPFKLLQQAQETLQSLDALRLDPVGRPIEKHTPKLLAPGFYEAHLIGSHGQDIRFRLREGDPTREILREAEDPEYDLIITGTRGHRGLKRFWVGSVAQEVALHAPCSILVAKNLQSDQGILVGVSGLETAMEAVRQAAELAEALQVPLTLLAVAPEESARTEAERHLLEARQLLGPVDFPLEARLRVGDPTRVILEDATGAQIIVLGRAPLSKVKKLLLGDVSLKILDQSLGPVLLAQYPRLLPEETESTLSPSRSA